MVKKLIFATLLLTLVLGATGAIRHVLARQASWQRPEVARAVEPKDYIPVIGRHGGRLVRATLGEPKSFNPVTSGEASTTEYAAYMFLGLTRTNAWTNEVEPELALSWTPDESGKVWTIRLREGVVWSDGHPFTADDVVFTYQTIYNKSITSSMRDIISGPNGEQWKVTKIDDHTLQFELFDLNAIFPELLGQSIIPRHRWAQAVQAGTFDSSMGTNIDPKDMVVSGPFMLGRYQTGRVTMVRNPRYYRKDAAGNPLPYLDEILTIIVPSVDVQTLKFSQGETDVLGVGGNDFPNLARPQKRSDYTIYRLGAAFGANFLIFNQNKGSDPKGRPFVAPHKLRWFRDRRFRQAMSHAIDRQFMVDGILNGLGYPQYGPLSHHPELPMAYTDVPIFEYDPDKARALLREMGLIDRNGDGILEDEQGHELAFTLTTNIENELREKVSAVIRQDLEKIGVRVNYRPMAFNTLITKLDYTYDWDACIMGLTGGPEPAWGGNVWKSSGRLHMWYPKQEKPSTEWEAEIDELFARGLTVLVPEQRVKVYHRWQQIVAEQQPLIYTIAGESMVALRNRFGNVFPSTLSGVLWNIDEIYVLDGK